MSSHAPAQAVGGPLWTPVFRILLAVALLGVVLSLYRFVAGIGATSAMNEHSRVDS